MNFIADENIDRLIVLALRAAGHPVYYVAESATGMKDELVLKYAVESNSLLVTSDRDFGEMVVRRKAVSSGVLFLRLEGTALEEKARLVCQLVNQKGTELKGNLPF